jgi:hypothetical protein
VLILLSEGISLHWAARFVSDRVDEALSLVRVFDRKVENTLVIDL